MIGDSAVQGANKDYNLLRAFIRNCRRSMRRPKVADTSGTPEMTGGALLMKSLVFKRLLEREILAPDEKFVGLLLPPTIGGVLANVALPMAHRVAVNLNYTASSDILNSCIAQCGIRQVLTSRRVMQKVKLDLNAKIVYLEDFRDKVTLADKLTAVTQAYATPAALLERWLGIDRIKPDDLLTVLFTSGSTGEPKGVMLSHANVGSNVDSINQVVHLT